MKLSPMSITVAPKPKTPAAANRLPPWKSSTSAAAVNAARAERQHRECHRQHREQEWMGHAGQDKFDANYGGFRECNRHGTVHRAANGVSDLARQALAGIAE